MKNLKRVRDEAYKVTENVIDKCFNLNNDSVKEMNFQDAAILGLLEDMIGKTSSLITLLEAQNSNVLDSITRMIFENYVYIKFILEKHSFERGKAYIYTQKINELKTFDSITEMSLLGSEIRKFLSLSRDQVIEKFPKLTSQEYRDNVKNVYLNELKFNKMSQKWYNFNGKISTFQDLCNYLHLDKEYKLIYKTFSSEVHANEAMKYFKFEENTVHVLGKGINKAIHCGSVSLFLMETVRSIYKYYQLLEDLKRFNNLIRLNKIVK